MVTLVATETEVELLEPATYKVSLAKVEEKASTKQITDEATGLTRSEPSIYLRWEFKVIEEGFEEAWPLRANSSTGFGPNAKARGWAEALLGRPLQPNEPVDFDEQLIGLVCNAVVKIKIVGEKKYNEVEALSPLLKKKPAKNGATPSGPLTNQEGEFIPAPSELLDRYQRAKEIANEVDEITRNRLKIAYSEIVGEGVRKSFDELAPALQFRVVLEYEDILGGEVPF